MLVDFRKIHVFVPPSSFDDDPIFEIAKKRQAFESVVAPIFAVLVDYLLNSEYARAPSC